MALTSNFPQDNIFSDREVPDIEEVIDQFKLKQKLNNPKEIPLNQGESILLEWEDNRLLFSMDYEGSLDGQPNHAMGSKYQFNSVTFHYSAKGIIDEKRVNLSTDITLTQNYKLVQSNQFVGGAKPQKHPVPHGPVLRAITRKDPDRRYWFLDPEKD